MKTKVLKALSSVAALLFLGGCIVSSVYPFYNDKDLTFDPGLTGHWVKADATNEFWDFAATNGAYSLLVEDASSTNGFSAHLFKLKNYRFLDLLTTNRGDFMMPVHLITKVSTDNTNWSLHFLDYGWLATYLETNRVELRNVLVPNRTDDTNGGQMLYLTAGTRDLQVFLLKHADDTNAFGSGSDVELKRAGP